jgi:hypothetical protein
MLRAHDWRDIKGYVWALPSGVGIQGEDPMVWEDLNGVLHAVTHGGGWGQPYGFIYYSVDGGYTWEGNNQQKVYENEVALVGGGSKLLSRRERPHVVLGKTGAPVGLTNGVTEAWPCTLEHVPDRPPCTIHSVLRISHARMLYLLESQGCWVEASLCAIVLHAVRVSTLDALLLLPS